MLIVDTSVLLPAADNADPHHAAAVSAITGKGPLVTTPLVVAETAYLIGRQLGAGAEAAFFRAIAAHELRIEPLTDHDTRRIAELIDRYIDLRLGGTDASLIALTERLGTTTIATLDRRHFAVVRPSHTDALELIP